MKILDPNERTPPKVSAAPAAKGVSPEVGVETPPLGIDHVRRRLIEGHGPRYWRSLEELADTPAFQELVEREFPRYAPNEWHHGTSRRNFLQLAGASMAFAGLAACTRQPEERIVPYVEQPENVVPGKPMTFATGMTIGGYATGLLAESHMGRPTKLDGSPQHPASLGASDAVHQAAILGLYDPDRSQALSRLGKIFSLDTFVNDIQPELRAQEAIGGTGLRILTETVTSPTTGWLLRRVLDRFPEAKWHQFDGLHRDHVRRAAHSAFGENLETRYDLDQARVILALDSDFLTFGPGHLRYARQFTHNRRLRGGGSGMNRMYALETTPSSTGTMADHRLPVRPSELAAFTLALAASLGVDGVSATHTLADPTLTRWLEAVTADLRSHRGESLVVVGEHAAPELHVLAHAINHTLGNAGTTVLHTDAVEVEPVDQTASLAELAADMHDGKVDVLFILGANPVYDSPGDLDFAAAMQQARVRIHLAPYNDETSEYCQWHVPQSHFLEGWGDARAFDGTVTLVQPLIEPLYESATDIEILTTLAGQRISDYDALREHWRERGLPGGEDDFETAWRRAVHDGTIGDTALPPKSADVRRDAVTTAADGLAAAATGRGLELVFRPDAAVLDGRFANNGWLQELPKPITLLTWDNAVLMSAATAQHLGIRSEQMLRLEHEGRSLEAVALVQPGQADDTLTLHLGYGRRRSGRVGSGRGFDANRLRTLASPWLSQGVEVERIDGEYRLATTQSHFNIEDQTDQATRRHQVRHGTLTEFETQPDFVQHIGHSPDPSLTMFPDWKYEGYSWGMAIDLGACTGCNACVVACQAENNIPIVGKDEVLNGREMQWLRIDRYYEGDLDRPAFHHQPVACMHCERAPCEIVCPVAATVHGPEGLNEMIYNRCVGTRYCSNNCPYKVRRFNFFKYADTKTPVLKLSRNPDVTVRSRGVMEKCTYCVQRINAARIEAKKADRRIADGEVTTACQEACPTEAIMFGDLNDPDARINEWKAESLNYTLLDELNNAPRTSYLAKISNPNPALLDHVAGDDPGSH